jgi:hypothetical protein
VPVSTDGAAAVGSVLLADPVVVQSPLG